MQFDWMPLSEPCQIYTVVLSYTCLLIGIKYYFGVSFYPLIILRVFCVTENPHINALSLLFVVKFNLNVSGLRELRALTLKSVKNSLSPRAANAWVSKCPVSSVSWIRNSYFQNQQNQTLSIYYRFCTCLSKPKLINPEVAWTMSIYLSVFTGILHLDAENCCTANWRKPSGWVNYLHDLEVLSINFLRTY